MTKNNLRESKIKLGPDSLPADILILKFGETSTTQGSYYMEKMHAKEVLTTYMKRGTDLFIDFNHAS